MSTSDDTINYSKKLGIDECEIVTIKKNTTTVRITDSEITEIKQNFDENYGIRIINDKKITSIQTTDKKNINKSLDSAFLSLKNLKAREFWKELPYKVESEKIKGSFDEKLESISGSISTDIAQDMINSADNDKVNTITGSLNIVSEDFELVNSNGLKFNDKATYISGIINAESETGSLPVSGIGHNCNKDFGEFFCKTNWGGCKKYVHRIN